MFLCCLSAEVELPWKRQFLPKAVFLGGGVVQDSVAGRAELPGDDDAAPDEVSG